MSNAQYLADDMPFAVEPKKVEKVDTHKLRQQVNRDQEFEEFETNPYVRGSAAHNVWTELYGDEL